MKTQKKQLLLERRRHRVRARISGTAERPRLSVRRSLSHVYAQIIDDISGKTLAAASDLGLGLKPKKGKKGEGKTSRAKAVGLALAEAAKKAGVKKVVFDRGGRTYHGRVKALALGAREGGLEF